MRNCFCGTKNKVIKLRCSYGNPALQSHDRPESPAVGFEMISRSSNSSSTSPYLSFSSNVLDEDTKAFHELINWLTCFDERPVRSTHSSSTQPVNSLISAHQMHNRRGVKLTEAECTLNWNMTKAAHEQIASDPVCSGWLV